MKELFRRWARDPGLVLALLGLTLFGIAMIYSAGVLNIPSVVTQGAWLRQGLWMVLALVAFTAVTRIPLRWYEWAAYPAFVLAAVVLAATLVVGTGAGTAQGVKSFLSVGGFSFQPAEMALAILSDVTGDAELALSLYQDFKWEFIAKLPRAQPWALNQLTIIAWLAAQADGSVHD